MLMAKSKHPDKFREGQTKINNKHYLEFGSGNDANTSMDASAVYHLNDSKVNLVVCLPVATCGYKLGTL